MFLSFFGACMRLHWLRIKKPLLYFCGMALLLLLFCFGAAAVGSLLLEGGGFSPITLAVADEAEESQIPQIMTRLADMEDIRTYIRPVSATPMSARVMVAEGDAAAAIIFPVGFLDSVYTGENYSPLLILDAARPLEVFGLSLLAESAGSMLVNAQKGSYFIQAVYDSIKPAAPESDRMLWEVDMKYAVWVLTRGAMYQPETVSPTGGALNVTQHYLLSALLFFCFIAPVGLLFSFYSWGRQSSWLLRVRGAGKPLPLYAAAQILWGSAAVFLFQVLTLAGLSAAGTALHKAAGRGTGAGLFSLNPTVSHLLSGMTPRLSPSILPGLLFIALFLSAFAFLCCNTGHLFSALSLDFILAGVFLIVSGGFIPAALLPKRISALSPYSPLTWMRGLLSGLYLPDAGPSAAACGIRLGFSCLALLAAAVLYCCRFEAGRGAGR
jgi:hypothetical protein